MLRDELFGIHGLEPEEIFRESSPQKMVVPNNWAVKATKTPYIMYTFHGIRVVKNTDPYNTFIGMFLIPYMHLYAPKQLLFCFFIAQFRFTKYNNLAR